MTLDVLRLGESKGVMKSKATFREGKAIEVELTRSARSTRSFERQTTTEALGVGGWLICRFRIGTFVYQWGVYDAVRVQGEADVPASLQARCRRVRREGIQRASEDKESGDEPH
jgi:hypothetical protein